MIDLENTKTVVIGIVMFMVIIGAIVITLKLMNPVMGFKEACISYKGEFYQLENTSCELLHKYCIYNCNLNGINYNLDDSPVINPFSLNQYTFNDFFCIKNCEYINKKAGSIVCVC